MVLFHRMWILFWGLSNGFVLFKGTTDPEFLMSPYNVVHALLLPVSLVLVAIGFVVSAKQDRFSFRLLAAVLVILVIHLFTVTTWFAATGAV